MDNERGTAGLYLCTGLILLFLAYRCISQPGGPADGWFFVSAIWAYVVIIDNLGYWLSGSSLLVSRTRELLPLALGSLGIVCIFEVLDLRLASWSYISLPFELPARYGVLLLMWAALLPMIFVTSELLSALSIPGKIASKRSQVAPGLLNLFYTAGISMLGLALAFPAVLGPLVFAAFFFLAEPVLFGSGLPSLLRELSWGLPAKVIRLALSGILCALAWNGISTFTGAHPVSAGFVKAGGVLALPFAAYAASAFFAIEAYSLYSLCSGLRGGRTWEKSVWAMRGKAPAPYFKWAAVIALFAAVSAVLRIVSASI